MEKRGNTYSLKGGTALRFLLNVPRPSTDLDFEGEQRIWVRRHVKRALRSAFPKTRYSVTYDLMRTGEIGITPPKGHGSAGLRLGVDYRDGGFEDVPTRIPLEKCTRYDGIVVYKPAELVHRKLETMVGPNARYKPRDIYDTGWVATKASRAGIVPAVHGRVTDHHRFLLQLHLTQIDALRAAVENVERQADEVLRPFREAADRLTTMPGVSETVARVIIAEIGVDMSRFPSAGPSGLVGGPVPAFGRECGEAPLDSDPSREPVAEDGAGSRPRGRRRGRRGATCNRNFGASRAGVARRRRSWRSPPPC